MKRILLAVLAGDAVAAIAFLTAGFVLYASAETRSASRMGDP